MKRLLLLVVVAGMTMAVSAQKRLVKISEKANEYVTLSYNADGTVAKVEEVDGSEVTKTSYSYASGEITATTNGYMEGFPVSFTTTYTIADGLVMKAQMKVMESKGSTGYVYSNGRLSKTTASLTGIPTYDSAVLQWSGNDVAKVTETDDEGEVKTYNLTPSDVTCNDPLVSLLFGMFVGIDLDEVAPYAPIADKIGTVPEHLAAKSVETEDDGTETYDLTYTKDADGYITKVVRKKTETPKIGTPDTETDTFTLEWADISTGITSAKAESAADATIYDLQGRQVSRPSKGLYIQNGKKILVK